MVSREDCVTSINSFIELPTFESAVQLLEYLCDIKNPPKKEEGIAAISAIPTVLYMILPEVIEHLSREFLIHKITKNGTTIIVY